MAFLAVRGRTLLPRKADGLVLNARSAICYAQGAAAVVDARPVSSARAPTTSMHSEAGSRGEDKYAIVNFDGVHQLLQEQQWYTCSKSVVQAAPGTSVRLGGVMALRQDAFTFERGAPYLPDAVVEAVVVEEYSMPAPAPRDSRQGTALGAQTMTRFRVTRIAAGEAVGDSQ